ncbi:MAG: hypothetical protein IJB79_04640 [Candidatus Gastranaerophilales bacterium]|nr:hypothetical protein [Candidatus Gastranaerophilales bacterium]
MNKIISLLLFGLLTLNLSVVAKEKISPVNHTQEYYETKADWNFNFSEGSSYLTDEQLKDAQEINEIDDKSSFIDKIINSSHFSSKTATKTYIPINKVQK